MRENSRARSPPRKGCGSQGETADDLASRRGSMTGRQDSWAGAFESSGGGRQRSSNLTAACPRRLAVRRGTVPVEPGVEIRKGGVGGRISESWPFRRTRRSGADRLRANRRSDRTVLPFMPVERIAPSGDHSGRQTLRIDVTGLARPGTDDGFGGGWGWQGRRRPTEPGKSSPGGPFRSGDLNRGAAAHGNPSGGAGPVARRIEEFFRVHPTLRLVRRRELGRGAPLRHRAGRAASDPSGGPRPRQADSRHQGDPEGPETGEHVGEHGSLHQGVGDLKPPFAAGNFARIQGLPRGLPFGGVFRLSGARGGGGGGGFVQGLPQSRDQLAANLPAERPAATDDHGRHNQRYEIPDHDRLLSVPSPRLASASPASVRQQVAFCIAPETFAPQGAFLDERPWGMDPARHRRMRAPIPARDPFRSGQFFAGRQIDQIPDGSGWDWCDCSGTAEFPDRWCCAGSGAAFSIFLRHSLSICRRSHRERFA